MAEVLGHQGVPEREAPADADDAAPVALPRAADEAALHRVARRRKREPVQRCQRVDVRWSVDEKADILRLADSLNVAAAHYVGAVVMAHIHGDLTLPGQRTQLDDYIDELNALRAQVARLGNNLNQIARRLNSGGDPHPGDSAALDQAHRTLETVREAVAGIDAAAHRAATGHLTGRVTDR
ncbi:plasmid mobilization relaxosome protein MobC [Streptomyces smyrnaeus]|uniref:plasmid mobilization relaxosome protein MobC n=1 Tax=Streptomyces smyrnaeus TaxID=1387713 RepID=UPI0027DC48F3|nr:plasmid mobilization relaxosome protein MobC [Streptomyces smyrnaeus]